MYLMDRRYLRILFHVFSSNFYKGSIILYFQLFLHIQLRYITYWIFQSFFKIIIRQS